MLRLESPPNKVYGLSLQVVSKAPPTLSSVRLHGAQTKCGKTIEFHPESSEGLAIMVHNRLLLPPPLQKMHS